MIELRSRLLRGTPAQYGIEAPSRVWAVVMDMGLDEGGAATVVALEDGNASLYTTGSFGIIGGFAHERVKAAALDLCRRAISHAADMPRLADIAYPKTGRIRLFILVPGDVLGFEAAEVELAAGKHRYSELVFAANRVITELRMISEGMEQK